MTYEWLRKHYHDKHYLCEEGNCINEQYTSVFRSSIDLQAHKAQTHSRELGKHGSKEARTLRLDFHLRPRHNPIVEAGRPNQYQPPHNYSNDIYAPERPINVRDTSDFPSLNGQNTTVLPCARSRKQNQHVNTRDLHSFPALSQESNMPQKPQSTSNTIRMATLLKKPPEPPKPDKKKNAAAGPSVPRMPNQARDFPSLDGNQQQLKTKEVVAVTSSANNSGSGSWVSKAKTANENGQDEKKKAKKEPAAIKKKVAEAPKLPGASDFPNLNKKLEPNKSNLAKLGNKKKPDNSKKNSTPTVQIESNNVNAKKSGGSQTTTVAENNSNNHSKKSVAVDSSNKSIDHIKENSRPKTKSAEAQQCNGRSGVTTTKATVASKMDPNNTKVVPSEPMRKESSFKKKESPSPPRVDKLVEAVTSDNNSQKDKKKRKKNENNKEPPLDSVAQLPPENFSITPKIPPGFENTVQQQVVRAPPGLSSLDDSNHPQLQQLKTPPGLSLTSGYNYHDIIDSGPTTTTTPTVIQTLYEYIHPIGSSIRNKMLINNLMAALIPACDESFDTFEKFKEMSTLFRKHLITAYDFYSYCVEALYPHSFKAVFLELVLLLPDIQKQQVGINIHLQLYHRRRNACRNVQALSTSFETHRHGTTCFFTYHLMQMKEKEMSIPLPLTRQIKISYIFISLPDFIKGNIYIYIYMYILSLFIYEPYPIKSFHLKKKK
ncbi:Hypothetical protein CINCED_3A019873 [Cinara cedri]|uniref:ZNF598/HEL2 PAH domain-containing protein n=1 Tax=Cinara cedri TaxID=506608 RepID=A0A5E4M965_9HEMI|nr:Hypothetical protein CINCED_3A019873 [Cinara cedri]